MLTGLAPVLLVPDVDAALEHYCERLGFETSPYVDEGRVIYGYAQRDECSIHLALCEQSPSTNSRLLPGMFDVYLWVDDVEELHDELRARGAEILEGPMKRACGLRDIRVRDLNGYVLGIGQPLD